jgi:site-specific recombinase XerD
MQNLTFFEMVQKILGHTDIRTTQVYADILQENIAKQIQRMGDFSFEK